MKTDLNLNVRLGVGGLYKFEAVRPDGSRRLLADWFHEGKNQPSAPNIVTDSGLEMIGTGSMSDFCKVGSGSTTPLATDTALATLIGTRTSADALASGVQSSSPYYCWFQLRYRFPAGTATGNISEVGVGAGSALFSRALILDSGGSPTTISVLPDEALDVTYELRLYPNLTDVTGTVDIGGIDYNYTIRAANITAWNNVSLAAAGVSSPWSLTPYSGGIGAITGGPSGTSASGIGVTLASYVANSHARTGLASFGLTQGNTGSGIRSLLVQSSSMGQYQIEFANATDGTVIPKDGSHTFTINTTYAWDRKAI